VIKVIGEGKIADERKKKAKKEEGHEIFKRVAS